MMKGKERVRRKHFSGVFKLPFLFLQLHIGTPGLTLRQKWGETFSLDAYVLPLWSEGDPVHKNFICVVCLPEQQTRSAFRFISSSFLVFLNIFPNCLFCLEAKRFWACVAKCVLFLAGYVRRPGKKANDVRRNSGEGHGGCDERDTLALVTSYVRVVGMWFGTLGRNMHAKERASLSLLSLYTSKNRDERMKS